MTTCRYPQPAKFIVLAEGGADGVIHDSYERDLLTSGRSRPTETRMRSELKLLWEEQDPVAETGVSDSKAMRDGIRAQVKPIRAGLETTGRLGVTLSNKSRGKEVTSIQAGAKAGEALQGPSLRFLARAHEIHASSRPRSVGGVKVRETKCIYGRTRRVQPLRTMESVKKV
ncbi:hypothetical protein NCU09720 [Neurospora crassa OR74A]|uniref:Uncharacterized protein n=1 Tax=Neurospora crassa (strain ATCC 24698 / 74-OR23-1A / CBS 708.71 / DSM 1257 / FGSC 987) TaxID=367110 RepID=Q7S2Q6_NEUCR|nr:hypothetical protein NCU09720 [Neurospora crassa OR74A]EAA29723.1 hypothetical protein NCU09720 [Neurospora crassa OR74A]|eukprot:XP_958959.1 hypothetical protein NCU09720 [Neurospora crassa OR74A]